MLSNQINHPTGIFLIIYLISFGICAASDCASSRQEWVRLRYTSLLSNVPPTINAGPLKDICPVTNTPSCCDQTTEREMYALGHRHLLHQANWLQIAEQMNNDSNALEYFFRSDLEQAKNRLHQFFSRIYGYNYKLHRSFFFRFFTDLEEYMAGRRGRLASLIDNFFSQLRDSIVSLIERSANPMLNNRPGESFNMGRGSANTATGGGFSTGGVGSSQTTPDEASEARRIKCLSERVAQLRPFDEVDVRLKARILEAYPPARMLVNVMSTASRLLSHLAFQVSERPDCVLGLTRFRFCAVCAGQPLTAVCPESCPRLMASCLHVNGPESAQLSAIWPRLIEAIVLATTRLERSFNFPAVNRNLQMEISEAITSLQARYEQTKSKFEAECRLGSAGRSVPTLFSSGGANLNNNGNNNARPQPIGRNQPASFPGWPPIGGGFRRWRRDTTTGGRVRSARSPQMASPEFLNWQTRPRGPPMGSHTQYGIQPGNPQVENAYQPVGAAEPNAGWGNAVTNEAVADVPERLMRWAGQLKRAYNGLSNLFAVPGANFCPTFSSGSNTTVSGSPQGNCWNPPQVAGSAPHHGISETLRQLTEATERLHQASASNGDPDALIIQLPSVMHPAMGAYPSQMGFNNPYVDQQPPYQLNNVPMGQWRPPVQPPAANPFHSNEATPDSQSDMFVGSGAGTHPGDQLPPIENSTPQDFYAPPLSSQTPPDYAQVPPRLNHPSPASPNSGSDTIDNPGSGQGGYYEPGYYYESSPPLEPPRMTTAAEPTVKQVSNRIDDRSDEQKATQPSVTSAPTVVNRTIDTLGSSINPMVTPTFTPSTTPITTRITEPATHPSTEASTTTSSIPSRSDDRSHTAISPVVVPPGNGWRTSEHTRNPPVEPSKPFEQGRLAFESQTSYQNPLPDDEDGLAEPSRVPPASTHVQPAPSPNNHQQSWMGAGGASAQGTGQPMWWENPQSGGSGAGYYQPQPYQPVGVNPPERNYNWAPGQPDTPSSQYSYMGGSGVRPPEPDRGYAGTPGALKPNPVFPYQDPQPSGSFGQHSAPEWSQPQAPHYLNNLAGQGSGSLTGPYTGVYPGGITPWQDNTHGSGTAETMGYVPERAEPNPQNQRPEEIPQPPALLPPRRKPEPALSHPPMPPPEVWVPAQLGPGQPVSSVLLVREYNVQGPFYGPETVPTKQNSARSTYAIYTMPIIVTVFRILHLL